MANELTKASLDGTSIKVPIGTPIITNDRSKNSSSIAALMSGTTLTSPDIKAVQASGVEGKQAGRDVVRNSIDFYTPENINDGKTVQWSFNDVDGTLSFIRSNGEVVTISGFLRQIDFGVGPTGPRGSPGLNGRDGRDGRDGKDGLNGCVGFQGLPGYIGEQGDYGEEGPLGPTGPSGLPGPTGPRGDTGPQGLHGMEGRRGPKGFTCPSSLRGPDGPQGRTMNANVGLGEYPSETDLIWASPACTAVPEPIEITLVSEETIYVILNCPAGQTINGVWEGPTSTQGFYFVRTYSDGSVQQTEPDYGGAYCAIPVEPPFTLETIDAEDSTLYLRVWYKLSDVTSTIESQRRVNFTIIKPNGTVYTVTKTGAWVTERSVESSQTPSISAYADSIFTENSPYVNTDGFSYYADGSTFIGTSSRVRLDGNSWVRDDNYRNVEYRTKAFRKIYEGV